VGDNKTTVVETGLYNLTKPDAPALIHYGKQAVRYGDRCLTKEQKAKG
jgi:hypothetical protein